MTQPPEQTNAELYVNLHRELGHVEGRVVILEKGQDRIEVKVDRMGETLGGKLDSLRDDLAYRRGYGSGGWKVASVVGALVALMLGIVMWGLTEYHRAQISGAVYKNTQEAAEQVLEQRGH
ncbi:MULTISPECIES: hypothetical protein [Halorhodospira]|uniref:hypothetical protein n=1 Tax=Halorhodospira TaxID=85108 RepID=UPI001EE797A2|nr:MULTISPECIES: hypothetical protein [Halorhodospira]MCG5526854.1 hypothetical protein [Halorhodospira halophila]MCG5542809.1 hypothetical protein [Halorhodospira sp. 9628]